MDVPTIEPHQPFNPYNELQILRHNAEIIKLVTKIDHNRFASAGSDCMVLIWDVAQGKQLHTLRGHSRPVTNMCLYYKIYPQETLTLPNPHEPPDEQEASICSLETSSKTEKPLLLTGASDRLVCMWNVDSGVCLLMLTDLEAPVRCLLVLKDLGFLAGGERLCMWNQEGACLCTYNIKEAEDIQQLIVMQKEFLIAVVDKKLVTYRVTSRQAENSENWSIDKRKHLQPHREAINCLIEVNENCFASGSLDGAIILWAVPSLNPTRYLNSIDDYEGNDKMYPYSVQFMFTLEQRYIFAAVGAGFSVYDTSTGKLTVKRAQAHYSKILHINFVYNGAFLATCSEDGSVRLWSVLSDDSSDYAKSSQAKKSEPTMEKFTKKSNEELRQWGYDVMKPKLLGECQAHSGAVQMCVDFGGEGFASCAADGTLLLWKDGIRQRKLRNEKVMKMFIPSNQEISGSV